MIFLIGTGLLLGAAFLKVKPPSWLQVDNLASLLLFIARFTRHESELHNFVLSVLHVMQHSSSPHAAPARARGSSSLSRKYLVDLMFFEHNYSEYSCEFMVRKSHIF